MASTPPSPSPYLSLSFPKQTSRHRLRSPSKFFFLLKKKSNKRNNKTGCASLGYCKGNTAQSLHSRKAPGRSRVQGQNLPQSPGHILLGYLRTTTSSTPECLGMQGDTKSRPPTKHTHTPCRECIQQAISFPQLPSGKGFLDAFLHFFTIRKGERGWAAEGGIDLNCSQFSFLEI